MTFYGIITLLREDRDPHVYFAWKELVNQCELPAEMLPPVPHFTWHVSRGYDLEMTNFALGQLAHKTKPFQVQASGLGLFTGAEPVLFLPVMKRIRLIRLHRRLWEMVSPLSSEPSNYYTPDNWIPHITLAFGDLYPERLTCAVERLAYREIQIEIPVDHLALGFFTAGESWGIIREFNFGKKGGIDETTSEPGEREF
jgi:2'-5' RNA ligase